MEAVIVVTGQPAWRDQAAQAAGNAYRLAPPYLTRDRYVARLADDGAAIILVDGEHPDWRFFTTTPTTSPATRRIPVVVVARDAAVRAEALSIGAAGVLAPDELALRLPGVLDELARVVDPQAAARMAQQCGDALPDEALEAVARFNDGEFYRQHDLFEALWMEETGPVRDLYRAILQVGIAYYQITRGNGRGAHKMLLRSVQWLALLPDVCRGVDVASLKADAAAVRAELERVGMDTDAFDHSLLKPVRLVERPA